MRVKWFFFAFFRYFRFVKSKFTCKFADNTYIGGKVLLKRWYLWQSVARMLLHTY